MFHMLELPDHTHWCSSPTVKLGTLRHSMLIFFQVYEPFLVSVTIKGLMLIVLWVGHSKTWQNAGSSIAKLFTTCCVWDQRSHESFILFCIQNTHEIYGNCTIWKFPTIQCTIATQKLRNWRTWFYHHTVPYAHTTGAEAEGLKTLVVSSHYAYTCTPCHARCQIPWCYLPWQAWEGDSGGTHWQVHNTYMYAHTTGNWGI